MEKPSDKQTCKTSEIEEVRQRWESQTLEGSLDKTPARKTEFTTWSGLPIKPIYTPADTKNLDYVRDIGFPGEYPFTRGPHPAMFRTRLWQIRQQTGVNTAEATAALKQCHTEGGMTAPTHIFDYTTRSGFASDDPAVEGFVGHSGVVAEYLPDFVVLWGSIPLDKEHVMLNNSCIAHIQVSGLVAAVEHQGTAPEKVKVTVQNDSLSSYVTEYDSRFAPEHHLRLTVDCIEYLIRHFPRANVMNVFGTNYPQAGSNAFQEVAFSFSCAIEIIEAVLKRGYHIDDFAPRITAQWSSSPDFFEEIAKHRAARRAWAKLMKERFHAQNPMSWCLKSYVLTSGRSLTTQQPMNNITRTALQTLSAVLGGSTAIEATPYGEGITLAATGDEVEVALRSQQIIAYETGVSDVVDPLGGSWYVEYLTDALEEKIWDYINKVDEMGGAIAAIKNGFFVGEMRKEIFRDKQLRDQGERISVGVNMFERKDEQVQLEAFEPDGELLRQHKDKIARMKQERDNGKLEEILARLRKAAAGSENIMPTTLEAVKAYATVAEITNALGDVFGFEDQRNARPVC
ncbi:MAG: methylmalonyl-CoA mutase [Chloroflexota bacterium]|nr:MAG: methylmalonyl-CoA mutase [Chloroflexota bacterium]